MSCINIERMKNALSLSKTLLHEIEHLNTKKPYHLNVIDELHIDENGHSRVLYKLLKFRNEKGEYEILKSFILFLKKKYLRLESIGSLDSITINNPEITQEEERIDLWVKEKDKYALIFENKACGANDQEAQLFRYIEKTRKQGFEDGQIFVFYLPQTKESDPSVQTWGEEKEKFANRYFKVPFREDILQWLENDILQNVRHKDFILLTAITQYVDYLKGYFNFRNNKETEMEQQEIIKNILGIKDRSNKDKLNSLNNRIKELQDVINLLSNYRGIILEEIKKEDKEKLKISITKDFYDFSYCDVEYGGVYLQLNEKNYKLYIGKDDRWYCQLEPESEDELEIKCNTLDISGIREILWLPQNYQGRLIWKYMKSGDSQNDAYDCLKEVISKVREYKKRSSIIHPNEQF